VTTVQRIPGTITRQCGDYKNIDYDDLDTLGVKTTLNAYRDCYDVTEIDRQGIK